MLTDLSRILDILPDSIPQEMREAHRWVPWVAVPRTRKDGRIEFTKVPIQARSPWKKASSIDPSTWSDFATAMKVVKQGKAHGLGFVLGDGWAGVDIDDAMTGDGRQLAAHCQEIVTRLRSYTELSVSQTGVHVIVHGDLPEGRKEGKIEMYAGGRFFTVTGHWIPLGSMLVEPRQEELNELYKELGDIRARRKREKRRGITKTPVAAVDLPPPASEEEIIEVAHRVCRGFAALWAGDISAYDGDCSRADLGLAGHLAFLCGRGRHGLVRSLMEKSGLKRDKWQRRDYLDRTINKAYSGRDDGDFFRWRQARSSTPVKASISSGEPSDASDGHAGALSLILEATLDDIGFARRLAAECMSRVRYVTDWQKWIYWDGRRWQLDDGAAATREAQNLRDRLWAEFAALPHEHKNEQALKFIKSCGGARHIRDIVGLTKSQDVIRMPYEHLDRDPFLLNVRNGTIDLRSGEFRSHRPEDLLTQLAAVDYMPDATADLWQDFIAEAMQDDAELIRFLQVSAGLVLTGDVSPQLLWCHYGQGANGKSTFLNSLANMLGDYAVAAPSNFLMMRRGESHPTEIAMLYGKRLVTAIECEGGQRLRESFVKMMTGGDKVAGRRMREDFWMIDPSWHIHVSFNDPPTLSGTDEGIRRRLKIIPWRACFKGPKQDRTVKERLESEEMRPGILNWCLAGLRDYLANGIPGAVAVAAETDEYVAGQDLFGLFLDECTETCFCECYFDELIRAFHGWLEERGEQARLWTGKRISNELKRRGFESVRCSAGSDRNRTLYRGLSLTVSVPARA